MLKREGYTVIAFQNPLTHLSEDIAATKRVIDAQNAPILVVGNSYGGAVITAAAARLVDLWTGAHDAQVGRVRRSPDQPNQRPRDRREADDLKLIASLLIRPG